MHHMKKASIRDLRYNFAEVERLLQEGETVEVTRRKRVIARLEPVKTARPGCPDFAQRMRSIFGRRTMKVTGADLVAQDRSRN